ncbi:MerR family DNA-binding transcriptional regulator [Halomonas halmophila]|uniref:MerR family DNA-binding transcriptional regulator n=1 Tax=Halomonas halmophila TaxID=252 RepID=UPI0035A23B55
MCHISTVHIVDEAPVAKRSGVPLSMVHFYEAKGLIGSRRNAGNHRQSPAVVLRYIAITRAAQSVSMPLEETDAPSEAYRPAPD